MALPLPRPQPEGGAPRSVPLRTTGYWTYEDYCAIPDDGRRYEVIGGELVVVPGPDWAHQNTAGMLYHMLLGYVLAFRLGKVGIAPFDIVLAPGMYFQPDVFFVSNERAPLLDRRGALLAPDLVVEVLSPSTRSRDLHEKRDAYAAAGVRHYWIADPLARWLEAYELSEDGYILAARRSGDETFEPALFPGLIIPLAELWS